MRVQTPALFLCLPLLLAACASPGTAEPAYEGCATDENWITFDDFEQTGRVSRDASAAPQWQEPATDAPLSAEMPATFAWQPTPSVAGTPSGDATCPQHQPTALQKGLAVRHLPTVSGTAYDLHIALAGSDVYRLLTTRQSTSVPPVLWSSWRGQTLTVTLYAAKLLRNEVSSGPYQAAAMSIRIAP